MKRKKPDVLDLGHVSGSGVDLDTGQRCWDALPRSAKMRFAQAFAKAAGIKPIRHCDAKTRKQNTTMHGNIDSRRGFRRRRRGSGDIGNDKNQLVDHIALRRV